MNVEESFQRVLNRALQGAQESHVTCLADAILVRAGKDMDHGYFVDHQLHIIYPETVVINNRERTRGIADVVISVMLDSTPLLVIECKRDNDIRTVDEGCAQLQAYMLLGEYPHGMLLTNTTSYLFIRGRRGRVVAIDEAEVYQIDGQIQDVIRYVASL